MNNYKLFIYSALLLAILSLFSMQAHAALLDRGTDSLGNRLIYDSDRQITWYDYSEPYNTWENQMIWASNLTVDFGGTIFDDWRLPATLEPDPSCITMGPVEGVNCLGSEMGHLYYVELGNIVGSSWECNLGVDCGLVNTGDFQHLLAGRYWADSALSSTNGAWCFDATYGVQNFHNTTDRGHYAIAVRSGDVVVNPEPVSSTLFIVGGATLGFRRFWKKKRPV